MNTPRKYSDEFKREVVAQAASGRNVAQVTRELDLSPGLIYKWRERYQLVDDRLAPSEARAEETEVRNSPAFNGEQIHMPYPMHFGSLLLKDQLCILD